MKVLLKSEKVCDVCKTKNTQDDLYFCMTHKHCFCKKCYTNDSKAAPKLYETSSCHKRYYLGFFDNSRYYNPIKDDCVLVKLPQIDEVKDDKDIQ